MGIGHCPGTFSRAKDVAGHPVAGSVKLQLGFNLGAYLFPEGTSGMETAARRGMNGTRHISFENHPLLLSVRVDHRYG